jgi:ribulose-phosphate 3-epimerase
MHDQVAKITRLRAEAKAHGYKYLIEVDGGITADTAKVCHEADVFVAGSFIFGRNFAEAIAALKA